MNFADALTGRELWIYGYNNQSRNVYNKLYTLYPNRVKGIIVSKHGVSSAEAKRDGEKNIVELSEVNLDGATVVIAANPRFYEGIKKKLQKHKYQNIIIYDYEMDNWLNTQLSDIPLLETRFLGICVGQACNFKCRDCMNFAPYALKDNLRYRLEDIEKELSKLLPFFAKVDRLHIQGGEPFLYSDLDKLLTFIETNFRHKIKKIQIATNGSIMPKKELLNILSSWKGYVVRISDYKKNEEIKTLTSLLDENKIKYEKYEFVNKNDKWVLGGGIDYSSPIDEDVSAKVQKCGWNTCYTVENGLVGRCARSIPARTLQKITICDDDYLDLNKELSIEEVAKYFMFIEVMDCCRHCKGSDGEVVDAAIQIESTTRKVPKLIDKLRKHICFKIGR